MLSKEQKHGILLFDEIILRESIAVKSSNLSYVGFENFGNEIHASNTKANHGLVFMFQSLSVNFCQPVAVFTSIGTVKGITLAQLIIKAISLLENSGVKVDGIVSDGAQTNRRLWTELGVNGSINDVKNSFQNPMDERRSIYVFSDVPHLMKNIRNRLNNKTTLKVHPDRPHVSWLHYQKVYELDVSQNTVVPTRVCPKITERHLKLDTFSKMTMKLATQIFSESMAKAIRFYRDHEKNEGLKDSIETENFTSKLNSVFDALNRKYTAEGIRKGSKDFDILKTTLIWLDNWETNFINGKITTNEFLTKSTSEGLRVSIKSTIELCNYLLDEVKLKYVLTNKLNQDRVEQFFGMVRQATGPNEHPTAPMFLQVYKLLSISSILKPPKTGNCQILDSTTPKITLTDLKELFKSNLSEREQKIEKLKEKMNNIIDEDDECDPLDAAVLDIILDHNYCEIQKSIAKECVIIYYICGFMCRQIVLKRTKCLICLSALNGSDTRPEAALTNLKSKGFLIYPNYTVFKLVSAIEEGFVKYCDVPEVFDKTVNFLLQHHQKLLKFPCVEHESEMITSIVQFYITLQMKQYTRNLNRETKKLS